MQSSPRTSHILLLTAVAGLIGFFQLGDAPLWDRDEPRNAGCAAEMIAADDWVVPIFNAELRTHKPVLLYWFMMTSYSAFGINEFGARFFSVIFGIGTVLLTYSMGRRLFHAEVGKWAGLILASTIMFNVASRAATPDALLIFCGALAIALFVHFAFDDRRGAASGLFPDSIWKAIAIYAAMGLGVLAKGPVGLVVPTAVIGMYLLIVRLEHSSTNSAEKTWTGRVLTCLRPFAPLHFLKTCWSMRPITAILTALAVAAPWYIWVALRTDGVWTQEFFWTHNVSRAANTMEGHSGPPILFYLAAIMVGFFPWSILTIPTGMHVYAKTRTASTTPRTNRAVALLLCWVGVYIGIFSIAQTKLPSYVTPCYPALAMLAGVFVHDWRTSNFIQRIWLKVGLGNLIAVGIALIIGLPLAAQRFLPGSEWLGVLGLIPLVGGILCWRLHSKQQHRAATTTLSYTAVAFLVFLMGIVPAEIGRHRSYDALFQITAAHQGPIASYGHLEPSWIFYGGRPIRDFETTERREFLEFLAANDQALIITTPQRLTELADASKTHPVSSEIDAGYQEKSTTDFEVVHETEYFLRDRPLLLVQAIDLASKQENLASSALAEEPGPHTGQAAHPVEDASTATRLRSVKRK